MGTTFEGEEIFQHFLTEGQSGFFPRKIQIEKNLLANRKNNRGMSRNPLFCVVPPPRGELVGENCVAWWGEKNAGPGRKGLPSPKSWMKSQEKAQGISVAGLHPWGGNQWRKRISSMSLRGKGSQFNERGKAIKRKRDFCQLFSTYNFIRAKGNRYR